MYKLKVSAVNLPSSSLFMQKIHFTYAVNKKILTICNKNVTAQVEKDS
jgi:hypothetical protein